MARYLWTTQVLITENLQSGFWSQLFTPASRALRDIARATAAVVRVELAATPGDPE